MTLIIIHSGFRASKCSIGCRYFQNMGMNSEINLRKPIIEMQMATYVNAKEILGRFEPIQLPGLTAGIFTNKTVG
jgi:hypothetical protein